MGKILPFVNWAGGKSQLISQMSSYFPKRHEYSQYIEPFIGGGIVFLTLQPHRAILGDSNDELINCYQVVRDDVETLIQLLSKHIHNSEYYYSLRQQDPKRMSPAARAARLIYLNKTCYNGIYRVNLKGQFNVPYGDRKAKIYDEANLREISFLLKNCDLVSQSYEKTLERARHGDFIYLDPPYHPLSNTSSFTKYTKNPFRIADQLKLAEEFKRLTALGCKVMLSNSDTELIRQSYSDFSLKTVVARRYINRDRKGRKPITELLVLNYEPPPIVLESPSLYCNCLQ